MEIENMPYKNSIKIFEEDSLYHTYARGINKKPIFKDREDYIVLKHIFRKYLTDGYTEKKFINGKTVYMPVSSVYGEVELLEYNFLVNHIHLLLRNIKVGGITKLMRRVFSNYVAYFNEKYKRQGPLIQGGYRAVKITSEGHAIVVSRYINLNHVKARISKKCKDYEFCSYNNYLLNKGPSWLTIDTFLRQKTDFPNLEKYLGKLDYEI